MQVPVLCQELARGTAILHTRSIIMPSSEQKRKIKKSIRYLVYSVLHGEDGLLTRCKAWTDPMAI